MIGSMMGHNLKRAFRSLKRRKIYSFLGILGFAIGLAAFISISLFVNQEYRMDTVYENHQRLYRLVEKNGHEQNVDIDYELYSVLNTKYPDIEMACPVYQKEIWPFLFHTENTFLKTPHFICTTNEFFDLFSIKVLQCLSDVPMPDKNSIVLPESTAKRLFPGIDPLGKVVSAFNNNKLTVTAIIQDLPAESSFRADLILNSENLSYRFGNSQRNGKRVKPTNHFILLKGDSSPEKLGQSLNSTLSVYNPNVGQVSLQPIKSMYFTTGIYGNRNKVGNTALIYLFAAIGGLILILSLVNYIHFLLASQLASKTKTGINLIHGARFKHIVSYCFIESSLSIGIALIVSICIVWFGLPMVNSISQTSLTFTDLYSSRLIIFLLCMVLGIICLVSFISGWSSSKNGISYLLKRRKIGYRNKLSSFLTVFQLSISIVLIVCAIAINGQLKMLHEKSLGFDAERVVKLEVPGAFKAHDVLKSQVEGLSFVQNCSWSDGGPGYINLEGTEESIGKAFNVLGISGDEDFISTMGISCVEGRNFLPSDLEKACLVNRATLKAFGCDNLEELLKVKDKLFWGITIVGVVSDFNTASLHSSIEPTCLIYSKESRFFLNVRLMEGSALEQMKQLKKLWGTIIPNYPFDPVFYNQYFNSLYKKEEKQGKAISFFSFITIFITCLGLLGQIIQHSVAMTKEIGICKVNGATIIEVMAMLNKDFVKWVAIAFVLACPIAWYAMSKWLENFAYKTTLSWWIFALAGLLALGIALLTVSWQSWRAATRNPVEALRYE
ncbi:ABC transporter permease [Sunxiuqinia rutila]|uniref:ABC transporter permease n=1 Tax=Sunxiuqinia rutila TaxID=1397841 RepID=UPI003D3603FC